VKDAHEIMNNGQQITEKTVANWSRPSGCHGPCVTPQAVRGPHWEQL